MEYFPLYSCAWLSNSSFVVGGGGGTSSRSGILNGLSIYDVITSDSGVSSLSRKEHWVTSDAIWSMSLAKSTLFCGIGHANAMFSTRDQLTPILSWESFVNAPERSIAVGGKYLATGAADGSVRLFTRPGFVPASSLEDAGSVGASSSSLFPSSMPAAPPISVEEPTPEDVAVKATLAPAPQDTAPSRPKNRREARLAKQVAAAKTAAVTSPPSPSSPSSAAPGSALALGTSPEASPAASVKSARAMRLAKIDADEQPTAPPLPQARPESSAVPGDVVPSFVRLLPPAFTMATSRALRLIASTPLSAVDGSVAAIVATRMPGSLPFAARAPNGTPLKDKRSPYPIVLQQYAPKGGSAITDVNVPEHIAFNPNLPVHLQGPLDHFGAVRLVRCEPGMLRVAPGEIIRDLCFSINDQLLCTISAHRATIHSVRAHKTVGHMVPSRGFEFRLCRFDPVLPQRLYLLEASCSAPRAILLAFDCTLMLEEPGRKESSIVTTGTVPSSPLQNLAPMLRHRGGGNTIAEDVRQRRSAGWSSSGEEEGTPLTATTRRRQMEALPCPPPHTHYRRVSETRALEGLMCLFDLVEAPDGPTTVPEELVRRIHLGADFFGAASSRRKTGRPARRVVLNMPRGAIVSACEMSPDRAFVALGVGGEPSGEIYLFSTKKGRLVGHSKVRRRRWAQSVVQGATDRQGPVTALAFRPDQCPPDPAIYAIPVARRLPPPLASVGLDGTVGLTMPRAWRSAGMLRYQVLGAALLVAAVVGTTRFLKSPAGQLVTHRVTNSTMSFVTHWFGWA